ncbi:MAG: DinB family protein [Janthinobacterium lividum]
MVGEQNQRASNEMVLRCAHGHFNAGIELMKSQFKQHVDTFARYNAWANTRLLDAVGYLTDRQYKADRGAFFRSVHGTLNHLLVTDRIWMRRFTGEGEAPERLDAILFDEFGALREARHAEDTRIIQYVSQLDDERLQGTISYRRVSTPEAITQALAPGLSHWFNHQTHHRGQVHAILTGLVGKAPELDLLFYERLVKAGAASGRAL